MRTFDGIGDCIFQKSNVIVYGIVDGRCEAIGVARCGSWRGLRSWMFGGVRSSSISESSKLVERRRRHFSRNEHMKLLTGFDWDYL